MIQKISKEKIAECAGLWLAEGDKVCNNEINFCNNSFGLIELFHKVITYLFKDYKFNIRIYVYTKNGEYVKIPIQNCKINRYIKRNATKPYFIFRLASVELNKIWKEIVKEISENKNYYACFLRGFFAGEGNIHTGSHSNRSIRIAQGKPMRLVESALDYFGISYTYSQMERSYVITSKSNWDKFAEGKLADLHPLKKERFWEVYNDFKEEHYTNNYLKMNIYNQLSLPFTSKDLSIRFKRSQARIYDVLDILKKENKINNFRVRSKDYWIKKCRNVIILSKIKQDYIKFLKNSNKTTKEISQHFNVNWKASFRRLKELERFKLVRRNKDKTWSLLDTHKKVIYI